MKEKEILYSNGSYWVFKNPIKDDIKKYIIMRDGITHATEVAFTCFEGNKGLETAIRRCKYFAEKYN